MDFADTSPMASLPDLDLTGNEVTVQTAAPATEERRERRSRDRYGRDRRERGERAPREGADTNADVAPQDNAVAAPAAEVRRTKPTPQLLCSARRKPQHRSLLPHRQALPQWSTGAAHRWQHR